MAGVVAQQAEVIKLEAEIKELLLPWLLLLLLVFFRCWLSLSSLLSLSSFLLFVVLLVLLLGMARPDARLL